MSLGGIAISVGVLVDAAVVLIENAHKHIERDGNKLDHWKIISNATKEVGPGPTAGGIVPIAPGV